MSDQDELVALIHEYAYRLDAGELDAVAALFEHAELGSTQHARRRRGAAEARTIYDRVIIYDDGTPQTLHQITNVNVQVDGATASGRSCFTVLQVTGQGLHPILAGEYHDRFERADGTWRFTERIFAARLTGDLSRHMKRE
jgi:SnoaL-like domain